MGITTKEREPIVAIEAELPLIAALEGYLARRRATRICLIGPDGEEVELPESVLRVLKEAVHELGRGNALAIMPVRAELTTQEAADLLNVSRQYLVRLLDEGEIPFSKTGTHRRIQAGDLVAYKQRRDERRRKGLKQLTRMSEDLGLYE